MRERFFEGFLDSIAAFAAADNNLVVEHIVETAAWMRLMSLPTGVTVSGLALVASMLVFVVVSLLTHSRAGEQLDPDVKLVMEA